MSAPEGPPEKPDFLPHDRMAMIEEIADLHQEDRELQTGEGPGYEAPTSARDLLEAEARERQRPGLLPPPGPMGFVDPREMHPPEQVPRPRVPSRPDPYAPPGHSVLEGYQSPSQVFDQERALQERFDQEFGEFSPAMRGWVDHIVEEAKAQGFDDCWGLRVWAGEKTRDALRENYDQWEEDLKEKNRRSGEGARLINPYKSHD